MYVYVAHEMFVKQIDYMFMHFHPYELCQRDKKNVALIYTYFIYVGVNLVNYINKLRVIFAHTVT